MTDEEYYNQLKNLNRTRTNSLNEIADTELAAYEKYANQQKNEASLSASQQRAALEQQNELQTAKSNALYANAGLGNASGTGYKSGLTETSELQRQLNLQNNISAVNSEERAALKSLQDLISQEKQNTISTKLTNESNYYDTAMSILQNKKASKDAALANFLALSEDATSLDQLDTYAALYGISDSDYANVAKLWTNTKLQDSTYTDAINITEKADTANIFTDKDKDNIKKENLLKEYSTLDSSLKKSWIIAKIKDETIKIDAKQAICEAYAEELIASIDSTTRYGAVKEEIQNLKNDDCLTESQESDLLDKMKSSEYNTDAFKNGGAGINVGISLVKNNGSTDSEAKIKFGQDFKVSVGGKIYWMEFGAKVTGDKKLNSRACTSSAKSSFWYYDNDVYYKDENGTSWHIGNVDRSEKGSKKSDFISALEATSK